MKYLHKIVLVTGTLVFCGNVAVAAVDAPKPIHAVRDAATAISIARKACSTGPRMEAQGKWHTELHNGSWRVWLQVKQPRSKCETVYDTQIRAADGQANGCTICVEGD